MLYRITYTYDNEKNNECFDLELTYEYVRYHPADCNGPAEGGCSYIEYEITNYTKYDENGKVISNKLSTAAEERMKSIFDKHYDYFHDICLEDFETRRYCYDEFLWG